MKVQTKKGLIDSTLLERLEHEEWTENSVTRKTVWLFNGEEVRSDIHVMILRGVESQVLTGS